MRTGVFSLIFAVIAVGCISTAADARPMRNGDGQSLDQILPQIREQHPGTFYDADGPFTGPNGRQHYRVKWMTPEGRVIWFNADSRTGRVSNSDRNSFDGPPPPRDNYPNRSDRNRFNGGDAAGNPYGPGNEDDRPRGRRRNDNGNWGYPERDGFPERGGNRGNNNPFGGWGGHEGGNQGGNRRHGHGH